MTALQSFSNLRRELEHRRVPYTLTSVRSEALMVHVAVPGQRIEIEFFDDGTCEVETFVSQGVHDIPDVISWLLPYFDDERL